MLGGYVRWVTAHAKLVVAAVSLVSFALLSRVATLRVEVDPDSQLPQTHPYIRALARLHDVFGEKNLVFIGLLPTSGNIYTPEFLAKLSEITDKVGALPGLVQRTYLSLALSKAVDIRGTPQGMEVQPLLEPAAQDDRRSANGARTYRSEFTIRGDDRCA